MHSLDNAELVRTLDRHKMLEMILGTPEQLTEVLERARSFAPPKGRSVSSVILGGIGGSAVAGDVARDWLKQRIKIPLEVCRDFRLPSYAGRDSLVVVASYSGETLEAHAQLSDAVKRRSNIVGIMSGGHLEKACRFRRIPILKIKPGFLPRAAFPSLFASVAVVLSRLAVARGIERELKIAAEKLRARRDQLDPEVPFEKNPAKTLAAGLHEKVPVVYALERVASVARRLKAQLNENSKVSALAGSIPEVCHNEVQGWDRTARLGGSQIAPVIIRDRWETRDETASIDSLTEVLAELGASQVHEICEEAETPVEWFLSTILLGDLGSFYLAILRGADPSSMDMINLLKERVRKRLGASWPATRGPARSEP